MRACEHWLCRLQKTLDRCDQQRTGSYSSARLQFEEDPDLVHAVIAEGSEKAGALARETMEELKMPLVLEAADEH